MGVRSSRAGPPPASPYTDEDDAGDGPAREDRTPTRPISPYGVVKRACEDLAALAQTRGLSCVGLRFFTVYGPRQRPDMAVRRMCEALAGGRPFTIYGDGSAARDLTHVDDAVDAALRALAAPGPAPVYNVGGGRRRRDPRGGRWRRNLCGGRAHQEAGA